MAISSDEVNGVVAYFARKKVREKPWVLESRLRITFHCI